MSCKHLDCDIIVAAIISDFINFLNTFADKEVRKETLRKHIFSTKNCIEKDKDSHFYGLGNVFTEGDEKRYFLFLKNCKNIKYLGNGYFSILDENIFLDSEGKIEKEKILKDIFSHAYSTETLKALNII